MNTLHRWAILALTAALTGAILMFAAYPVAGASNRKMALGVSMAADRSVGELDAFTASVGRAPAVWGVWVDWGGQDTAFPTSLMNDLRDRGVTPMVHWQPIGPGFDDGRYRYKRIIMGDFDEYITQWAQKAARFGDTVLLRFAHEMNGYWFPWGIGRFDNTPFRFKKAWKHVSNIFKDQGASNVKFVWSPYKPCGDCASYASIYPGDDHVAFASFSAFNWSTPGPWKSMTSIFRSGMSEIASVTSKKVIIAETGTSAKGGDEGLWVQNGYRAVYDRWPKLKAIVYFNLDMRYRQQPNWLLRNAALEEYAELLTKEKFQGTFR